MQIASTRRAAILPAADNGGGGRGRGSLAYGGASSGMSSGMTGSLSGSAASGGAGGIGGGVGASVSYLSMYAEPPEVELTLEDFEVTAFDRLRGT